MVNIAQHISTKQRHSACIILLAFLPFFVIKTFHFHEIPSTTSESTAATSFNNYHSCAICLFTLSSALEATQAEYIFDISYVIFAFVLPTLVIRKHERCSLFLRAPPSKTFFC